MTLCVVGAGTAGLEGLLYARDRLGPDVNLRLIAPEREFRYRPMSRDSLFHPALERSLSVADLVTHTGATWVADRADVIRHEEQTVLTRDGDTVGFDHLLVAAGSRSVRALRQGHVWQRGGDPGVLDLVISELGVGEARTVAVVAPRGARWPLPAYELALVLAWTAAGTGAQVTLITAEDKPLSAIGTAATQTVTAELAEAGVHVISGVEAAEDVDAAEGDAVRGGDADGHPVRLRLGPGSTVEFDRVISLPTVIGPALAGVPTDAAGFIEVDDSLRVCGSEHVWAAGGCLAAALDYSALAAQQADAAIEAIRSAAGDSGGLPMTSTPGAPELTGMLLSGQRERWLAENPPGTREPSTRCLWWPPGRAVGKMLARQISAWDPSVQEALPGDPGGLLIRAPVALECTGASYAGSEAEVSAETRVARLRDIENRQLAAMRRQERGAAAELKSMRARLQTLTHDQEQVVRELQQHGYLLAHGKANSPR